MEEVMARVRIFLLEPLAAAVFGHLVPGALDVARRDDGGYTDRFVGLLLQSFADRGFESNEGFGGEGNKSELEGANEGEKADWMGIEREGRRGALT